MEDLMLADYFTVLRRWKIVFSLTMLVFQALSANFALHWSNYRSTATIQVEQPEISSSATSPLGSNPHDQMEASADQRISALQQKVFSTASLIEIITKFNLYLKERQDTPIAIVAEKTMLKKTKLELVSSTVANPTAATKEALSAIAFTISFDYQDPLIAQQVTDDLATRFLDEDLKERRTETKETATFLANQIAALEASLSEQEKNISEFQKKNGVTRPESLAFNQQIIATLTLNMQSLDAQIATNEGNLGGLRAQLASIDPYSRVVADGQVLTTPSIQLKALQAQYTTLTAQYGPDHPDVMKVRHQIEALQSQVGHVSKKTAQLKSQIADLRTNLATAEKTYGPDHPDVISLRSQLNKMEDQMATGKQAAGGSDELVPDADNPTYLGFSAQLHAAQEQHNSLLDQRKELQAQIDKYQTALIENPEAQKEMAALARDYENGQLRYRELKEKKMAADMGEQMQKDRTGERLTLIDPPELPIGTHPARILFFILGIFLSFMGSFACVALAQVISQSVVGPRHLESLVGVAPLVAVPHIYTSEERETSFLMDPELLRVLKLIGVPLLSVYERFDPRHERFIKLCDWIRQGMWRSAKREKSSSQP